MKRFHSDERYFYDFTTSGFFTLVNQNGEPLYEKALPFFEKAYSHLIWIFLWFTLIAFSHFACPTVWHFFCDRILMILIFFHLFIFGCRLTSLLLKGGLWPILFPPLWVRLTRRMQKGLGLELLKSKDLAAHPGLLANLSLICFIQKRHREAEQALHLALNILPDHPHLLLLQQAYEQATKTD